MRYINSNIIFKIKNKYNLMESIAKTNNNSIKKNEIVIKAGIMSVHEGKIKPDSSKGEIRVFLSDGMILFQWTNLDKNIADEPLAIFSGEWEWTKIPSSKGRVYVMRSKCFEDAQYYFWIQSPNKEEDLLNEKYLNEIFDSGNFDCLNICDKNKESEDKTEITGVNNFEQNKINSAANGGNEKNISNQDFIKNMANTFKNIRQKYPKLGKVVTKKNIQTAVDDNKIEELLKLLPENQQSKEDFYSNLSSAQFKQALESLSEALDSENLLSVLQSFGLDMSLANTSINGVEVFIKCLIKKYSKKNE